MSTTNKKTTDKKSQPATKAGVKADMAALGTSLRKDMAAMGTSLRKDMATMETGLRKDMATKAGVKADIAALGTSLRKDMATKKGVKADLAAMEISLRKDMATKQDLQEVNADVQILKQDNVSLKAAVAKNQVSIDKLAIQTLKNTGDIEWMKENMATKADHNRVMTALDKVLTEVMINRDERIASTEWLKRLDNEKADKKEVERLR